MGNEKGLEEDEYNDVVGDRSSWLVVAFIQT